MNRAASPLVLLLALHPLLAACDDEAGADGAPVAAPSPSVQSPAGDEAAGNRTQPDEIYFDLTRFDWYREGRPLVHDGRPYLPQADPTPVDLELQKAGSYEGVTYYETAHGGEPVYTLYVPVYYRYWQRFTSPPGN